MTATPLLEWTAKQGLRNTQRFLGGFVCVVWRSCSKFADAQFPLERTRNKPEIDIHTSIYSSAPASNQQQDPPSARAKNGNPRLHTPSSAHTHIHAPTARKREGDRHTCTHPRTCFCSALVVVEKSISAGKLVGENVMPDGT